MSIEEGPIEHKGSFRLGENSTGEPQDEDLLKEEVERILSEKSPYDLGNIDEVIEMLESMPISKESIAEMARDIDPYNSNDVDDYFRMHENNKR